MFADRKCIVSTASVCDDRGMMPTLRNCGESINYSVVVVLIWLSAVEMLCGLC